VQLEASWSKVEQRLQAIGEGAAPSIDKVEADQALEALGLLDGDGLSDTGTALFMARFVVDSDSEAEEVLREVLKQHSVVTTFCEPLWAIDSIPTSGAISLLKRVTGSSDEKQARRWLDLMNRARLVVYNRANPKVSVLYNPSELGSEGEDAVRERTRGHVIRPQRPYGNVLALRDMLRAARGAIRWYEKHMEAKTVEVLYREVAGQDVDEIRLLSGPPKAERFDDLKDDFKRFRTEMKAERAIEVEWRVLDSKEAFRHHDRFFITEGFARNLPPVNSILANSTGEILPSELTADDFDEWWTKAGSLQSFAPKK
jgi:hypothetical protein